MSRRIKIIIGVLIVVIILGVGFYFYQQQQSVAKAATLNRQTATLTQGELTATVSGAGNITAPVQSALSFSTGNVPIVQVNVHPGDRVKKGAVLAQEDTSTLQGQVSVAKSNLMSAQTKLGELKSPPNLAANLAISEANVASAQSAYDSAEAKLKASQAPPDAESVNAARASVSSALATYTAATTKASMSNDQIVVARAALQQAQITLDGAQKAYDAVAWKPSTTNSAESQALQNATVAYEAAQSTYNLALADINDTAVKSAGASLASSKSTLDTLLKGTASADLAAAQSTVTSASQALMQAKQDLETLKQGATQTDLTAAQASVASAQATLDTAQAGLSQAQIIAPFDGTVADVKGFVGQTATAGAEVMTLVDPNNLQIAISLSEVDVSSVKPGQDVQITFDALSGRTFDGKVLSVSPLGATSSGVVNYTVTVGLTNPDPAILPGMTAQTAIVTASVPNAVIAPARSIRTLNNRKLMTLLFEGKDVPLIVQTGLSSETGTQILSAATADGTAVNLQDGDTVVLNTTTTTTPGGGGGFGGGPGGGGFIPIGR